MAKPVRIQGCFVSEKEIKNLITYLRQYKNAGYNEQITSQAISSPDSSSKNLLSVNGQERDALFDQALTLIYNSGKASASLMQRRLKIGYARAARLLDQLEKSGIVGPANGAKPRQILKASGQETVSS